MLIPCLEERKVILYPVKYVSLGVLAQILGVKTWDAKVIFLPCQNALFMYQLAEGVTEAREEQLMDRAY